MVELHRHDFVGGGYVKEIIYRVQYQSSHITKSVQMQGGHIQKTGICLSYSDVIIENSKIKNDIAVLSVLQINTWFKNMKIYFISSLKEGKDKF